MFYVSLGIVFFILLASLFFRRRFFWKKSIKAYFYLSLPAVFIFLLFLCDIQFSQWQQGDISQYLLPPHQPMNYFVFYCFNKFLLPYLISCAAAVSFLFVTKFLNKKRAEKFFEPEEPYFGALGIFLSGFPGFIFYFLLLVAAYLVLHLCFLVCRRSGRVPMYHLWLPVAIFAIIINNFAIQNLSVWQTLKI